MAADDAKLACVTASSDGQRLRDEGDLLGARRAFLTCSAAACPGLVQEACVGWTSDLERQVPSVVISVRDAEGKDLAGATVFVDGRSSSAAASGSAIELNPGPHEIRVEAERFAEERTVTLAVGEQGRRVQFTAAPPPTPPEPRKGNQPVADAPSRVLPWTFLGISAAALGGSLYLGISTRSQRIELERSCAPRCGDEQIDPLRRKLLVGDVLLATSVLAAGGAAWFFFSAPASNDTQVAVGPAALAVRGRF